MIVFHDVDKEYGFLSNWYKCDFYIEGKLFTSVEKYLMYRKAVIFEDKTMEKAILDSDDPAVIKDLGRQVKGFVSVIWNGYRQIVLYKALLSKFTQNTCLRKQLLDTGDEVLAEGSYNDTNFADGLHFGDKDQYDMSKWRGKNLLGFTLMQVRDELKA